MLQRKWDIIGVNKYLHPATIDANIHIYNVKCSSQRNDEVDDSIYRNFQVKIDAGIYRFQNACIITLELVIWNLRFRSQMTTVYDYRRIFKILKYSNGFMSVYDGKSLTHVYAAWIPKEPDFTSIGGLNWVLAF